MLKFIEALFDKDVNQSEQQERDHKATRGSTKPSSEKETVTEGLVPAVERSSEEETATVVGSRRSELRTPVVERSSCEETVTEGLLPAVERSSEEETATVDGNSGQDPRTLDPDGTRDQMTSDSDGRLGAVLRTMVVERSSGEETVTSSMRVGLRPSVEAEPATSSMLPVERPTRDRHCIRFFIRRSGPILQLIELRRGYSRRTTR